MIEAEITIIGGGPASLGITSRGDLPNFVKQNKLTIVDAGGLNGGGNLQQLKIPSNSPWKDFYDDLKGLDHLEDLIKYYDGVFDPDGLVVLEEVAKFLNAVGKRTYEVIGNSGGHIIEGKVESINYHPFNPFAYSLLGVAGNLIETQNLILATGGSPRELPELKNFPHKTQSADSFFRIEDVDKFIEDLGESKELIIVGGRHGALGALARLGIFEKFPNVKIKIVTNQRPLIYFSADEIATGSYCGEVEIDENTGQGNRYLGVRGPAKEFAEKLLRGELPNVELLIGLSEDEKQRIFSDSSKIINAAGYSRNDVPISWSGRRLQPSLNGNGAHLTRNNQPIYDAKGDLILHGLYALGLGTIPQGSKFAPDGVNSFRETGREIINSILQIKHMA